MSERITGKLKWFDSKKGYGFITPDDNSQDVFVHITAVLDSGLQELLEGQKVSFEPIEESKGLKAVDIANVE